LEHNNEHGGTLTCFQETRLAGPILVGGSIAGVLDLTSALITNGVSVPRSIAAGLIGVQAAHSASRFP
jgi:hypothetical protein